VLGYFPVRKLVRLGVQIGLCEYARRNATPSATKRSRLGVRI